MYNLGIKWLMCIWSILNESELSLGYFQTEANAPYIARHAWFKHVSHLRCNDIVWSVNLIGRTRAARRCPLCRPRGNTLTQISVFNLTWNLNQEGRSLMIPAKVAAVCMPPRRPEGAASICGQSWGHLLWTAAHLQRISMLGNTQEHDLMSDNLQRVCGSAECWWNNK